MSGVAGTHRLGGGQRTASEAQGAVRNTGGPIMGGGGTSGSGGGHIVGKGPLEGGLPDAGSLIALADIATDRLYVVVESEQGALHLHLSDMVAREELLNPAAAVRLAFRRTVRCGEGWGQVVQHVGIHISTHFRSPAWIGWIVLVRLLWLVRG
jgi:hypothetical protein